MQQSRHQQQDGLSLDLALHYAHKTVMFADVVESVRLIQRDEIAAASRIRKLLLEAANETALEMIASASGWPSSPRRNQPGWPAWVR